MIRRKHPAFAVISAFLASTPALAADYFGANTEAMGRAAVANWDDNSAISINPGALGLAERYTLMAQLQVGPGLDLAFGASAVDSKTTPQVALGVGYRGTIADPPLTADDMPGWFAPGDPIANRKRSHEVSLALAVPVLDRKLSFGLGGAVIARNDDRGGQVITGTLDAGFAWRIDERWSVGLAGRNLIPTLAKVPPAGVTAGLYFREEHVGAWALDIDWQATGDPRFPLSFRAGGEVRTSAVRTRLGYRFEGADLMSWIVPGLGVENDVGGIEYALSIPVSGSTRWRDLLHTISARARF